MGDTEIQLPSKKIYSQQVLLSHSMVLKWCTDCFFVQYGLSGEREAINDLIEKAILEADKKGVKVLSLGLLNQACPFIQYLSCVQLCDEVIVRYVPQPLPTMLS